MICFELSSEEWKILNTALYHAEDAYHKEGIHSMSDTIEAIRAKIEGKKRAEQDGSMKALN